MVCLDLYAEIASFTDRSSANAVIKKVTNLQ